MTRAVGAAAAVLVLLQLVGLGVHRESALVVAGAALGPLLAVLLARLRPGGGRRSVGAAPEPHWLGQWIARTGALLEHADGSGADWDRRLRPVLAREFLAASGCRRDDRAGCVAAGRAMFGDPLWRWVDPAASAGGVDGPGRAGLTEILDRLAVSRR
ncbi:hypothetical protein [Skermania piniformis]|uniref:Uncharacterized protein n=1 Tax=Skermania pinensis TaxID=39122 RepID=A0ABX8S9L0_9ACTN|nr:hypothetical protein [Skermania piniformis]QXQ13986.1 hypothetical protein KV203_00480 [Skermania piniformis]